ncbi:MAG: hypothetical protein HKN87_24180, partial [Saprospiraceae bacterium]|nr:hypothetical protein [Saprospiraceae bacterium]
MRNYHLLSTLAKKNKVYVISAKFKYSKYPGTYDRSSAKIYESINIDYRSLQMLLRFFFETKGNKGGRNRGRWMRKLIDSFPTHLLFGEGGFMYIIHSYFLAMHIIRRHNIDCIYSSFRTHADHIVASLIRSTRRDIIWVADFADFPIDSVVDNVYLPKFQRRCLQIILKRADAIAGVSHGILSTMPVTDQEVSLLTNGVDANSVGLEPMPFNKFTISYTGSLYGKRSVEPLFFLLYKLLKEGQIDGSKIQLIYAGSYAEAWMSMVQKFNLQKYSVCLGAIEHDKAIEIQQKSHINVLLTWASAEMQGWLTFKVYEYIRAGRPILALIQGSMDKELDALL